MTGSAVKVSDQGGLAGAYTPMTDVRALQLLQRTYGLEGTLTRFATEKDDTFRLTTGSGARYVLKVANPTEPLEEIDFQNRLIRYAKWIDRALPIPEPIKTTRGQDIFAFTDIDGRNRYVRLLTYIEGTPLVETGSNADERVQIGRMLGRLRLATAGFEHPGANRQYAWDVQHLSTLEHLLEHVDDPGQHKALTAGLARFRQIEPALRGLRQQVLHNDFSKSNLVVDHSDPDFVTGVIDFGDAVKTAIAIDVSTACLNQLPLTPQADLFAQARDIVEGYLHMADLTQDELRLIPHLVMARVVTRALLTLWRRKLFPDNETYIMRNTAQGWHQLDWFLSHSPDQISDTLSNFLPLAGQPK